MSAAYSQTTESALSANPGTNQGSGAFTSIAAGSTILWECSYVLTGGTTVEITRSGDSAGNIVELGSRFGMAVADRYVHRGYIKNASAGTNQVVANFGSVASPVSVQDRQICAIVITGADVTTPVGSSESAGQPLDAPSNATDAFSSGNAMPTVQPGLLVSLAIEFSTGAAHLAEGTGFTPRYTGGNYGFGNQMKIEDRAYSALSAAAGNWTCQSGDYGFVVAWFVRDASSGGLPNVMLLNS